MIQYHRDVNLPQVRIKISAFFFFLMEIRLYVDSKYHMEMKIITSSHEIPLKSNVGRGVNQVSYYN